ncbi:MAG: PQQ-dependent sugar dehydrogenase, partial [Myxococcaceae bacterium]|nr:PQQ-dependent sugar dehydrogenase [Myxococcaceae bacterium]
METQGGSGTRGALQSLRLLTVVLSLLARSTVFAATLPPGFQESTVINGLNLPTVVRFAPDERVFVAEKNGRIKVFDNLSDTTPDV